MPNNAFPLSLNCPKVLLVQVGLNGDCLLATTIARQIKEVDYPGCHLTWAVGSKYKQTLFMNPHVDDIWEILDDQCLTNTQKWDVFLSEVNAVRQKGQFDFVFITQGLGENWLKFDGGLRSSAYNNYPHKVSVPAAPVVILSQAEIKRVKNFAKNHSLNKYKNVLLIEYGPTSFDSDLNLDSGYKFAIDFANRHKDTALILSANKQFSSPLENVIDASNLSFRENAELSKYCNLFIGCGSGITWLLTSTWAKKLNTVLLVNQLSGILPSLQYDHKHLNLPTDHIIEIKNGQNSMVKLNECLNKILTAGFAGAREDFNEKIALVNHDFLYQQLRAAADELSWGKYFSALRRYFKRNGLHAVKNINTYEMILQSLRGIKYRFKRKPTGTPANI